MEYPCPSLDNIPLPDGAQPIRDRKKPGICLSISPGTSDAPIATDGQLIPFNMADVPLPSTKYNAANTPALSIPLPEEGSNNNNSLSSSSSASSSSASSSSSSSKMLVDKLFEDFLSQKIKKPERSTKLLQSSSKPVFTNSVEEIKRFLDKEINQLSCKVGFSDAGSEPATETVAPLEKEVGDHEENPGAENSSAVGNQRVTAAVPLKIKISDSSVARISSGHLAASSDDQLQPDELISKFPVNEEETVPATNAAPSENLPRSATPTQCDPILELVDPESNGVADVEAKSSKSSKKHKHKKKKSHKHSKDKNKSTQKIRPHSKKHKSLAKSHSKPKHKSSNSTKSPKKTSKSSHSKSKSSKKSKKTKTKTDSKSKSLTEPSETENKSTKKSSTLSTPPENQSIEDGFFGNASAIDQIPHLNLALKSPQKDKSDPPIRLEHDGTFCSQPGFSTSPESSGKVIKDTEDSLVQKDIGSSPLFQPKTLPSKTILSPPLPLPSSPPPPLPPPLLEIPTPTTALVMPVTDSSTPQLATVSPKLGVAPLLVTEPECTPATELPAVSEHSPQHKTQSVPSCAASPMGLVSHLDPLKQSPPAASEVDESPQISKLSFSASVSSSLNQPSLLSPAKGLQPVEHLNLPAVETLPTLGMPNTSQETLLNCSQSSSAQTVTPVTSVPVEIPQNPTEPSEHDGKVNSSTKAITKNSVAGQSGLLGLAAYFKSKVRSPSPESKKGKPAKSSNKKSKSSSVSSDESVTRKRSRSTSRSASKKHSSSDKQKRSRPRSKRLRSVSSSRSRSKSKRRQSSKSTKKRDRSRSRSRSDDRSRPSAFRSNKRRLSRSLSRSRKKTYGRSRSRSRSRGRNRISGRGSSRSRSPTKRATTYRQTHSRSRSRSKGRYRHRISSRSIKSRSRSRSRSDIKSRDKRTRSRSTGRHRDSRPSNNKFRRFSRRRSRSRSSSASSSHSRRRRSPIKADASMAIDKVKLHDFAVKKLLESGQAPKEEVASLRAGGKTVQGLIDYCKRISQKENESDSDDSTQAALKSAEEEESPFIHHPFRLRESQPNIVLNIKNAKPLPVLTPQDKLIQSSTLRLQFPVSSGSQHRAKESEWVPVPKNPASSTLAAADNSVSSTLASSRASTAADGAIASELSGFVAEAEGVATNLTATGPQSVEIAEDTYNTDSVFPEFTQQSIDISQAMTERMLAVQKLQENPNDVQALNLMYKAQQEVNRWAQSKQLPGQFTGSTGAKVMSQEELNGPDKRFQAWAKKEQLQNAAPVSGGIGMHLLQKMGWRQGEGLGKHNEGPTEPIMVNVKVDRKGLTSQGEDPKKSLSVEVAGKHPVSALVELCSKCKWGTPMFQQVEEKGPDHKKSFMFKVTVNNVTYQPTMVSNSKKNGRARAAILCLQDIGLLPKTFLI